MKKSLIVMAVLLVLGLSGCTSQQPFGRSRAPGLEYSQYEIERLHRLHQTERFDPYVDTRSGPELVGVRPPGFEKPRPDPANVRDWSPQLWQP